MFGLRGCRVYVGLFSGLDLLFGFRGCRVYVGFVVWASWVSGARRGSGGGDGGCLRVVGAIVGECRAVYVGG